MEDDFPTWYTPSVNTEEERLTPRKWYWIDSKELQQWERDDNEHARERIKWTYIKRKGLLRLTKVKLTVERNVYYIQLRVDDDRLRYTLNPEIVHRCFPDAKRREFLIRRHAEQQEIKRA